VDPAVMRDVIGEALFAGSLYAPLADAMLAGNHSASPSVRRALQIVDLAMAAGNSGHVPLPGLDACRDRLLTAVAHGDGLRAWTVVAREPSKASGL
jgi:3-hydroxyisobutyrate dehydrogenase-like beta-hydroxyacid dehydrogenase